MDIVCEHCQSKFKIPDEKIPAGKVVSVPCPKCKNKITVKSPQTTEPPPPTADTGPNETDTPHGDAYDASEKPFDFVEEEGKTALICESDPGVKKTIKSALEKMEYQITDAKDARDAVTKMRYHVYHLILVNESFDTSDPDQNDVLGYLERLSMTVRRNIFVAMITSRFRTMDNMMAFNKSVNMVLNLKNIADTEKILTGGITESDFFYRIYKDTLKKLGKV